MANTRQEEKTKAPRCPPLADLPPSEVIWQGVVPHLDGTCPCRVVVRHLWELRHKAEAWTIKVEYLYEVARTADAMDVRRYETTELTELPGAFFADALAAFGRIRDA